MKGGCIMVYFNCEICINGCERDGKKMVVLSFFDFEKENLGIHHFPIPLDIAADVGEEIIRLATELKNKEES